MRAARPVSTGCRVASRLAPIIAGLWLASQLTAAWSLDPNALPTGGTVVGGSATINSTSATRLDILQSSQRTAINWQTFNIGSAAQVNFAQPNSSAVALNRVLAGSASEIAGRLTSNGQVFLVNPAGVLFSRSAQVNVGAMVASTLDLSPADFMAGSASFSRSGAAGGIVNQGTLAANSGGYIALLAPNVRNEGVITATLGTVALGAGDRVTLDFSGDRLLGLRVDVGTLNAAIANRQLVVADGGQVIMSARAADALAASVVNNEGIIQARSLVERNGVIRLEAAQVSNSGTIDASGAGGASGGAVALQGGYGPGQGVALSGTVDASGASGGEVRILGGALTLAGANVDASGASAGGTIFVGGGAHGGDASMRNADTVSVDSASTLDVSATGNGNGGQAVVWSEQDTSFAGTVYARGGAQGGNGGFVETSGKHLSIGDSARVDTLAPKGNAGNWLLDPVSFTIAATGGDITGAVLGAALDLSDVTITTAAGSATCTGASCGAGTAGPGDINVNDAVTWTLLPTTLTLSAFHDVNVTQPITATGGGSVVLRADNTGTGPGAAAGTVNFSGAGSVTLTTGTAAIFYNPSAYNSLNTYAGNVTGGSVASHALVFTQGDNKVYDGTNAASLSFKGTPTAGGVVTLVPGAATFSDKNVGTGKTINFSGYTLGGADAGKFSLFADTGTTTANITARSVGINNVTANSKIYDALTAATLNTGTAALALQSGSSGLIAGDVVNLNSSGVTGAFADKNVGTGKAVTVSGFSINGGDAGNYSLVQPAGVTANITVRSVGINNVTANNKIYDALTAATLNTGTAALAPQSGSTGFITGDAVTLSSAGATGTFANKNVGTGKAVTASGFTIGGVDATNYSLVQPAGLTANITVRSVGINNVTANSKIYDALTGTTLNTGTAALAGQSGSTGFIAGDVVTLNSGAATGSFADKNVGAGKAVTASGFTISGTDATNYSLVQPAGLTASITVRSVGINNVTANSKIYDALLATTLNTGTAALAGVSGSTGLIGGDTVTLSSAGATGAFADKNVGAGKAVTASGFTISGTDAGNYSLVQPAGLTASITVRSVGINNVTANNRAYNAGTNATLNTGTAALAGQSGSTGFIAGDVVTLNSASATGSFANRDVGTAKPVTVSGFTISGTDAGNYSLVQPAGVTANITQASLTVTANNGAKTFGTTYTFLGTEFASSGLQGGETIGSVTLTSTGAPNNANVGTYPIVASAATGGTFTPGNYSINYVNGTLTVSAAAVTLVVTANNAAKIYGQTLTFTGTEFTSSGLQNGDTIGSVTLTSTGAVNTANVGTYPIVPSNATGGTFNPANYTISYVNGTLTVSKAALTITAATNSKTYDATTSATATPTVTGLQNADTVTGLAEVYADKNAGTNKTLTVSAFTVNDGAGGGNYTVTLVPNTTGVITQRSLTVTATGTNKVYDGTTTAAVTLGDNRIAGDVLTITNTAATFADRNVGTAKTVSVTGINVTGTDAVNYSFNTTASTTANITQRAITVTAVTGTKTYDGTTSSAGVPTITVGALQTGDTTTTFVQTYDTRNAGTSKTLTPSGVVNDGNGGNNYSYTYTPVATGTINKLPITVTATTNSKVYDGTTSSAGVPTITVGALQTGDTTTTFIQTYDNRNAGSGKTLTPSGVVNDGNSGNNYSYTYTPVATGTITQRPITVTAVTDTKTYDGTTAASVGVTPAITGGLGTGDTSGFVQTFDTKNAGSGKTLTPSGVANDGNGGLNYTVTFATVATGTINVRVLTITAVTNTKTYDGTTTAAAIPTITSGTLASGDSITLTEAYTTKDAGTLKALVPTATITDGNGGANYAVTLVNNNTGVINPKVVNLDAQRVFDGTTNFTIDATHTFTATISGTVGTETLIIASGTGTVPNPNVAAGTQVLTIGTLTLANGANGGLASNYTLVGGMHTGTITGGFVVNLTASRAYDGSVNFTAGSPGTTFTITGAQGGDILTIASGTGTVPSANVAVGQTLSIGSLTLGGTNAANYTLIGGTNTATITPKTVTVAGTRQYNALTTFVAGSFTPAFTGLVGTETLTFASGQGTVPSANASAVAQTLTVGTLVLGNGTGLASNYTLLTTGNTATITAKPVNLSATRVYDNTTAFTAGAFTPTLTGMVGTETLTIASGTGTVVSENVGAGKVLTPGTLALGNGTTGTIGLASNYTLVGGTHTAAITARPITVTAAANTKTYDGTTSAAALPTLTSGTIAAGDAAAFTEAYADKNAGTGKTLTLSGAVTDGNGGANYLVTFANAATGTINKRPITITAATNSRTYDGTTGASALPTITSGNIVSGDSVVLAETYADKNAGTNKTLIPTATITDGNGGANYLVTPVNNTTGRIDPRTITVTATTSTKVYDGTTSAAATPTITSGALQGTDTALLVETYTTTGVGTGKTLTPTVTISDGNNGANYAVTLQNVATGAITPAPLTIRADDKMMIVNTLLPTFTATESGFVNGESLADLTGTLVFSTPATSQSGIGTYSITPAGVTSSNYSISFVSGTLMILLQPTTDIVQNSAIGSAVQSMGDLPPDAQSSGRPSPGRRLFATGEDGARSEKFDYTNRVSLTVRDGGVRLPAGLLQRL